MSAPVTFSFPSVELAAIASSLPRRKVAVREYESVFGKSRVEEFIESTGIEELRRTLDTQTAMDLGFLAARELLEHLEMNSLQVDCLIFVTQSPDYIRPGNASVLHHFLKMRPGAMAIDIHQACAGFVYGLTVASSLIESGNISNVLLVAAETSSKVVHPRDSKLSMMFGDAGSATLLHKVPVASNPVFAVVGSDGSGFPALIVPGGGFRNRDADDSEKTLLDGTITSETSLQMNGIEVTRMARREVPEAVETLLGLSGMSRNDVDYWVLHQANKFMIGLMSRELGVGGKKVLESFRQFGNTSSASIPLTISIASKDFPPGPHQFVAVGFGTGFSWGAAKFGVDSKNLLPPIESDLNVWNRLP